MLRSSAVGVIVKMRKINETKLLIHVNSGSSRTTTRKLDEFLGTRVADLTSMARNVLFYSLVICNMVLSLAVAVHVEWP